MEFEIGIGKTARRAYGFDEVAIVPSRRTRDPEDVSIEWEIAPQVRQELGKTHRLHRGEAGIEAACGERLRLGQRAGLDHLNEPGIARCVKPPSRRRQ